MNTCNKIKSSSYMLTYLAFSLDLSHVFQISGLGHTSLCKDQLLLPFDKQKGRQRVMMGHLEDRWNPSLLCSECCQALSFQAVFREVSQSSSEG